MTEDGTFKYTWNGENRLIQVEPKTPASGDLRLTFSYPVIPPGWREPGLRDFPPSPRWLRRTGMGRRVQKVVEEYNGSSWSTNAVTKFVWDLSAVPTGQAGGWLLIAELDGLDSDALTRTYTWGLDLSGTFRGAGGISGLLMVDAAAGDGFCGYYAYDGNGNVGQVLDAEDLSTDAHYEYDPYGREIVATGTYADANPWRFSTKHLDILDPNDTDASLLHYGYRYLSPRLGRWMSRDPIGEAGSLNTVAFLFNRPLQGADPNGLSPLEMRCGMCGPDVTEALRQTLRKLRASFAQLRSDDPQAADANCRPFKRALYAQPPSGWIFGAVFWDMKGLVGDPDSSGAWTQLCPQGNCEETVNLDDGCYHTWDVNYLAYGWMNKLCGVSKSDMEMRIAAWSRMPWKWGSLSHLEQKLGFARAGYEWYPEGGSPPPAPAWYWGCDPCPDQVDKDLGLSWPFPWAGHDLSPPPHYVVVPNPLPPVEPPLVPSPLPPPVN